jgi:hypothetical protein
MTKDELIALAERVEAATMTNNELDVLVEVVLFEPDAFYKSCRANDAGTKVVYTNKRGREETFWSQDWTLGPENRVRTAAALRARAGEA